MNDVRDGFEVHCLAREHLGAAYDVGCIELNASDDRGIDVVREKIKAWSPPFEFSTSNSQGI